MPKNSKKGDSYHLVLSKLKECSKSDDIFHLIGLIASCESIMSDRLSAFLGGTKNAKYKEAIEKNDFISIRDLIKYSKKELKGKIEIKQKVGGVLTTENLLSELRAWVKKRNQVVHAVCHSPSSVSHKSLNTLFSEAKTTCLDGQRLVQLLLKWSKKTKHTHKQNT